MFQEQRKPSLTRSWPFSTSRWRQRTSAVGAAAAATTCLTSLNLKKSFWSETSEPENSRFSCRWKTNFQFRKLHFDKPDTDVRATDTDTDDDDADDDDDAYDDADDSEDDDKYVDADTDVAATATDTSGEQWELLTGDLTSCKNRLFASKGRYCKRREDASSRQLVFI